MTLAEVFEQVQLQLPLPPDLALRGEVTGLAYDSRQVQAGNLFFAFPGARADGRAFAEDALRRGAIAAVSESPKPEGFAGPWIQVAHGRHALATAARNFYRHPDERI